MSSYDFIRGIVDAALVEVSECLKDASDCETLTPQQSVSEAVRAPAESARCSSAGAPGTLNKRLGRIIRGAAGRDELARLDSLSSCTASRNAYADASGSRARSSDVWLSISML